jgi:hypothetical protein
MTGFSITYKNGNKVITVILAIIMTRMEYPGHILKIQEKK